MSLKAVHAARGFKTGAKKSPRSALLAAMPFRAVAAPPPDFAIVPPLDMWDNDVNGVCVSSEEAFAKAWWSMFCGLPSTFASAAEVRAFATRYGWLNGATLTEVMDRMIQTGMSIGGKLYKDGAYSGVDYSNEATLQAALCVGPVKIAIDSGALPNGAGNGQGWYDITGGHYPDTDHCVGLSGYGSAEFLYRKLGVQKPAGVPGTMRGYLLFTWSTLGFVTHDWLMGTCVEAWVRNPTTPGQIPAPPLPPGPVALSLTATPPNGAAPLTVIFNGQSATAAKIGFGDGTEVAAFYDGITHTYGSPGTYVATVTNSGGEMATATVSVGTAPPAPEDLGVIIIPDRRTPDKRVSFYGPLNRVYTITIPGDVIPGGTYSVQPTPRRFHEEADGAAAEIPAEAIESLPLGLNWQNLLDNLPAILALIRALTGK